MSGYKYTFVKFIRDWMLIISILAGAGAFLIYHSIPSVHSFGPFLLKCCRIVQPLLLFLMLLLSFCKIEPSRIRVHRWHFSLLLIQGGVFVLLSLPILSALSHHGGCSGFILDNRLLIETAMLCMICPTATACAVVTGKLGGNMADVVTYTVLVNILVAVLVPFFFPAMYPMEGMSFWKAFSMILLKVFPLLLMPCVCALAIRYLFPHLHELLLKYSHVSFYLWAVALSIAILMSTRAIVHSNEGAGLLVGIALVSFICCIFQFWAGKKIGARYGSRISGGQALGQKNTVFAIWMGYTFLNPVVSVAGGFYSIWHNLFNTWQLYKKRKENEASCVEKKVEN